MSNCCRAERRVELIAYVPCQAPLVAIAVPDFGVFTNLVGNLFTPVIGFLFPPALYLLIRRDRRRARAQAGKPSNADFWGTAKEAWACFVALVGLCLIVLGMRSFIQDP